ncbi:MAG: hypothetical protein LRY37_04670 [Alkalibacterium thalassium]|nr:hypothetical protein [Alkalibacterium thalassium]
MGYLSLAIICSAAIALIFKYTENTLTNRYVITSANYFFASVTSLVMIMYQRLLTGVNREGSFINELSILSGNESRLFSPYASVIWGYL